MLPTSQVQFYIDEMNCISNRIFILEERSVWAGSVKPVIVNQSVTVFKLGKWLQKIVTFFFVKLWTAWVYNPRQTYILMTKTIKINLPVCVLTKFHLSLITL